MKKKNVLITGNSSGLGYGFTEEFVSRGYAVYGLSRRGCSELEGEIFDLQCDLADFSSIGPALDVLLRDAKTLDLVILNAGILGDIKDLQNTSVEEIREVMDVNVWANKLIMDWLIKSGITVQQIVLISSGAAVNGSRGWSAYALSKATLNMLTMLYAAEFPDTHLCALAPGLVDTAMQDYLCDADKVDSSAFPSIERLRGARGTESMPTPRVAAKLIADAIPGLKAYPSGCFQDIRKLPV